MAFVEGVNWEISLIGLSLTAFTLITIFSKSYKHPTDWLLCVWLILLNMPLIHTALSHLNFELDTFYLFSNPMLNLLHGPILYLYTRMLIKSEKQSFHKFEAFHYIPFTLFYSLFLVMDHPHRMEPQPDRINSDVGPTSQSNLTEFFEPLLHYFGLISVLLFIAYSIATIYTLKKHQTNILGILSQYDNQISLKWIYLLPLSFVSLTLLNVAYESYFGSSNYLDPLTIHLVSFLSFILLLCFFGVKQKPIFRFKKQFSEKEITDKCGLTLEASKALNDETTTHLNDEFISQTIKSMQTYMQNEKPFCDPDFSVYTLAKALNIPRRSLSFVLNTGLSKNFYQYVNDFRIEEVKLKLANQDEKSTILDIAYDAGFKSKSSFNSLFKQHCQVTPSQYRKSLKY